MLLPARPKIGDRGSVHAALHDLVDAGGTLEYGRGALLRTIEIAQQEWDTLSVDLNGLETENWSGLSTRAVYYDFYAAVTWTRSVRDRFEDRLKMALQHDRDFWNQLQRIRSEAAGPVFEDAGHLPNCYLHNFTPPYPNFSARVERGAITYPVVDNIATNAQRDYPAILEHNFKLGRHAAAVVDQYWDAVSNFIDRLLDLFYPGYSAKN